MGISIPTASSSLEPLPYGIRYGMVVLGTCGLLSLLSTFSLFLFFTHRMINWRRFSAHSLARTQVFVLIYNLFIADILQASSFVISFWWVSKNKLVGPNMICDTQGLLIQIGDVASGLWALAIALHTFFNIVGQKNIAHRTFVTLVLLLWSFILILAAIGPIRGSEDFFVPAGAWCWVNNHNHTERLYFHYLWIFASELGSVALYTFMFYYLRIRIKTSMPQKIVANSNTCSSPAVNISFVQHNNTLLSAKSTTLTPGVQNLKSFSASRTYILKSSRHMVIYTLAYLALTLPLAAGRALNMVGKEPPIGYFTAAGILIACSGFVDVTLYVGTRRLLLTSTVARESMDGKDGNGKNPIFGEHSERNDSIMKSENDSNTKNLEATLSLMKLEAAITKPFSYCDKGESGKVGRPV